MFCSRKERRLLLKLKEAERAVRNMHGATTRAQWLFSLAIDRIQKALDALRSEAL